MKKIVLLAILASFLISPIYSETFQEYQKKQEEKKKTYEDEQTRKFKKFVEKRDKELEEFIKKRELDSQKYWGLVNEEFFSETQQSSDDEEPAPFQVKFSVCFNCSNSGTDLQVANEDQNGTFGWEAAKSSCEKKGDGWYLPTKDELLKIYELKKEMGGFSDIEYWSISQEWKTSDKNSALAGAVNFKDGKSGLYNPNETKRVRCVRRMPDSQDGSKKVIIKYSKNTKDTTKEEKVQQPKSVEKVKDIPPKNETKKENLKSNNNFTVFTKDEFVWPVRNYCHRVITSTFGPRQAIIKGKPVEGKKGDHRGIDIACQGIKIKGKSVTAAAAGKVVYAGFDKGRNKSYGNYIIIEHPDGSRTIYGHLDAITVNQGDNVMQGHEIGKAGDTGFVTGPHLHFEVRNNKNEPLDPLKYLPEMKK